MIDRRYFEEVLPDQLRLVEKPARLTIHLTDGTEHLVHSMVAAHDGYVVLKVYGDRKPPQHTKPWQAANPGADATIYDQIAVPYFTITSTSLTARSTRGDDARSVIGFRAP